jgi:hypothetical protein
MANVDDVASGPWFGRRLEPRGHRVLHGAGQSPEAFAQYTAALGDSRPLIFMTYCGLKTDLAKYFDSLAGWLQPWSNPLVIPQIGLSMTKDGSPEQHYEHLVAAGSFDHAIEAFCRGLQQLGRPAFVRIGYEFNGQWNGYEPEAYRAAWVRIVHALRRHHLKDVAVVWCYAPDGNNKQYRAFHPGNEHVDWWSVDCFSPEHFSAADTVAFMADARAARCPVMIGECTPRQIGVHNGRASWEAWFARYFAFIHAHDHLKAVCYINWDWANYPQWSDWGDARIQANPVVLDLYRRELAHPIFLHAAPEPEARAALGL